jgi:tellurite resistance protein TehA-like permease
MRKTKPQKLGDYLFAGALVILLALALAGFFHWMFYDGTVSAKVHTQLSKWPAGLPDVPK